MRDNAQLMRVLHTALAWERDAFGNDTPISGADLVDWFSQWRLSLRAALAGMPDPFLHPHPEDMQP